MAVILSDKASLDLQSIYFSGLENFGVYQADKYFWALHGIFDLILQNPQIGRLETRADKQTYRIQYKSHIILYSINDLNIDIECILHKSVDIPRHF